MRLGRNGNDDDKECLDYSNVSRLFGAPWTQEVVYDLVEYFLIAERSLKNGI